MKESFSCKKYYALVRVTGCIYHFGGFLTAVPLAILIQEEERWYFTIFEGENCLETIEKYIIEASAASRSIQ
jgi:hypothetical protein